MPYDVRNKLERHPISFVMPLVYNSYQRLVMHVIRANRLKNIPDRIFRKYLDFAVENPAIVELSQIIQKLIIFDFVLPYLEKYPHESILDVGCGQGIHSCLLSEYGSVHATDMEVSESWMGRDLGNRRAAIMERLKNHNIEFSINNGMSLDYPDRTFDIVFHNSVIEHVPDQKVFNREVFRVLKPGGVCICITGTTLLSRFRFCRNYIMVFPALLVLSLYRELGQSREEHSIVCRLERGVDKRYQPSTPPDMQIAFRTLYPRLRHYLDQPEYNRILISRMADSLGMSEEEFLTAAADHFRKSFIERMLIRMTPPTHGQHYRNASHERREWSLSNWRRLFEGSGFMIENVQGFRFHYLLEWTGSANLNTYLYYLFAKYLHLKNMNPECATEFIMAARRPL